MTKEIKEYRPDRQLFKMHYDLYTSWKAICDFIDVADKRTVKILENDYPFSVPIDEIKMLDWCGDFWIDHGNFRELKHISYDDITNGRYESPYKNDSLIMALSNFQSILTELSIYDSEYSEYRTDEYDLYNNYLSKNYPFEYDLPYTSHDVDIWLYSINERL